ncbi:MAG: DUF418 domain-containing protein [Parvibaculaceae bacterium]|nr:DUF418 domain-containing protein [Parvibaculaceae bacterium]
MPESKSVQRLTGLDLARFLAFCGMVIVNFKIVMGVGVSTSPLDMFAIALEGRAAATFIVLAGLGLGLSSTYRDRNHTVSTTLARSAFLLAVGLLNMMIFEADIIHYYAFYFLFGVYLLTYSTKALCLLIVILNLAFMALLFIVDYEAGWDFTTFAYEGFWTPTGFIRNLFYNGWHPFIPWLGFFVLGVVLSRLPLTRTSTQIILMGLGLAALLFAETSATIAQPLLADMDPELAELATTSPLPPTPLYFLAGSGAAAMVIGLCLFIAPWLEKTGMLKLVTPAGRQTLTLYIAHILLGMGTLEELGLLGNQSIENALLAAFLFCLAATLYALLWARHFKAGPIETLMRKLAG